MIRLFMVVGVALVSLVGCAPSSQQADKAATVETVETVPAAVDVTHWQYQVIDQEMTDDKGHAAAIGSKNTVEFKFPYGGPQRAGLTVMYKKDLGYGVAFSIERGQILCNVDSHCQLTFRLDDDKPFVVEAMKSNDQSSDKVFIFNADGLVAKIFAASRLKVQTTVFQNGSPVFDFDVANFDQRKFAGGG